MNKIPSIFSFTDKPLQVTELIGYSGSEYWAEFCTHLAQFGHWDLAKTSAHFELLLKKASAPPQQASIYAGIGRCIIHEGDLIKGAQTLGYAWSLVKKGPQDVQAFILLEMASFLAIVGQDDIALLLIDRVRKLTKISYLLKIAQFHELVYNLQSGDKNGFEPLLESAEYFESVRQFSTVATHYKNIGNGYRKLGSYFQAADYYRHGIKLCETHDFRHISDAIKHDLGLLRIYQGKNSEGLTIIREVIRTAASHFTRCHALSSMGLLDLKKKEWRTAAANFQEALNIAGNHGVFHLLPGICYYLAVCYENEDKPELAGYFYQKGYDAAHELLVHHFTFSGDRRRAVDGYVQFIRNRQPDQDSPIVNEFSFAIDRTLYEIRAIFQETLLEMMLEFHGSVRGTASHLKMAERTYFSVRERNRQFRIKSPPPESVKEFVKKHKNLDWKAVNSKFESELFSYLFEEYDGNKKTLSEKLGVSYPYLVQRTRALKRTGLALSAGKGNSKRNSLT